jgi:hypothetical protein
VNSAQRVFDDDGKGFSEGRETKDKALYERKMAIEYVQKISVLAYVRTRISVDQDISTVRILLYYLIRHRNSRSLCILDSDVEQALGVIL